MSEEKGLLASFRFVANKLVFDALEMENKK